VAVAQGRRALPPVQQVVARLHPPGQFLRPGDDPRPEAPVLVEAPAGEGQQPARCNTLRQRPQQGQACRAPRHMVQHPEQRHQIVLPGVRRAGDDVPPLQRERDRPPGQRLRRPIQQRSVRIQPVIAQRHTLRQPLRQEDAQPPVAAAGIQHGELARRGRHGQVRPQGQPAGPGRAARAVEFLPDRAVEVAVDLHQAADGGVVHRKHGRGHPASAGWGMPPAPFPAQHICAIAFPMRPANKGQQDHSLSPRPVRLFTNFR